jgi:hypothetical protein
MVLASFTQLSTATKASYSIIQAGVARGLSSKAINADIALRYGKGVRRQDLLQGMRVAGGVRTQGLNISNVRKDRRPSYARFPTFAPVTSNKRYLVQYEVRWSDPETGQTGSRYITVGTDARLTAGELDEAAKLAYEQGQGAARYKKNETLTSLVPVGARQQF